MALLLSILKNIWPKLSINNRTPVNRTIFIRDRDGNPISDRDSEVINNRS